jgi:hypothetical protein
MPTFLPTIAATANVKFGSADALATVKNRGLLSVSFFYADWVFSESDICDALSTCSELRRASRDPSLSTTP